MYRKLSILLVLAAGAAIYWWTRPRSPSAVQELPSDLEQCRENLRAIYQGLLAFEAKTGRAPEGSGPAFLGELVSSEVFENTRSSVRRLTCPGPGAEPMADGTNFKDLASLGPKSSAYAARDTRAFPLAKFPSGGAELEPLVACDDARGMNHEGALNVLFSDGTVRTYEIARLVADGTLPPGTTTIVVGPGSPLPELQKLAGDGAQ
jgi:hypothetical protein